MVAGGGGAKGRDARWYCKFCKTKGDQPFWNYPDKLACHKCHGSKSSCFLRNVPPKSPVQRTPVGESARFAAMQRKQQELEATIRQLKLDNKKVGNVGNGKKDDEGDEDMEEDDGQDNVQENEEDLRLELEVLDKEILGLDKLVTAKAKDLATELRAEREVISKKLREAKPVDKQIQVLANKVSKATRALAKQQASIQEQEVKLAELTDKIAKEREKEVELEVALAEAQAQMANLSTRAAITPPKSPTDKVPGLDCTLAHLGVVLAQLGVDKELVEKFTTGATQRAQPPLTEAAAEPPGVAAGQVPAGGGDAARGLAATAQTATGSGGGEVGGSQESGGMATSSPSPALAGTQGPLLPPTKDQPPKPAPTTPAARARAASAGRKTELEVGAGDLEALRKELGEVGLGATDEQLRVLGGRLGAWTLVVSKRQRQSKA